MTATLVTVGWLLSGWLSGALLTRCHRRRFGPSHSDALFNYTFSLFVGPIGLLATLLVLWSFRKPTRS